MSYVPMTANTDHKPRKFFRLSSYDYPIFDLKKHFSKTDNFTDRGYYPINNNKPKEIRPKYKSMNSEEFTDKLSEDHFYEDLCYNDVKDDGVKALPNQTQVKPCMVKLQELFQSFKLPFFKRTEEEATKPQEREARNVAKAEDVMKERDGNIYENSSLNMYDSIHVAPEPDLNKKEDLKHVSRYLTTSKFFSRNLY